MKTQQSKLQTGFRSLSYRSKYVYNFLTNKILNQKEKFRLIGLLVGKNKRVFDVPCGTGMLVRYLHPSVEYMGWDLNRHFLRIFYKDYLRERFKVKKFIIREKNIFDFQDYPNGGKDVFVMCDILHHIYPRHIELLENAKKCAKKIIICEPLGTTPDYLRGYDPIGKAAVFFIKFFPERILKALDYVFADNDGINSYENRNCWQHNEKSLKKFYRRMGFRKSITVQDEIIGIWEKNDN